MESASKFSAIEGSITQNSKLAFTAVSYATVLLIFLNLNSLNSPAFGAAATLIYLIINGTFLANAFFKDETLFVRCMLGNLVLIFLLGTIAWLAMATYRIDISGTAIVLLSTTTLCSLLNSFENKAGRKITNTNSSDSSLPAQTSISPQRASKMLHLPILQLAYLFMIILSFYLLFLSRGPEVYTVWGSIHPAFMPVFFAATLMLFLVLLSPYSASYKLPFVFAETILVATLFVIIFPASGDIGGQQTVLGNARLIYDNIIPRGLGSSSESPFMIVHFFMEDYLNAFTVVLARMFAIDILWSHVLFMPVAWGIFVPLAAFMVARVLKQTEDVSVLASVLVLVFPLSLTWGTNTVPMSLGYIASFWAIYFALKYLSSEKDKSPFFAVAFCLFSLVAHFFAGILAFAFLVLAITFKRYEKEKRRSRFGAGTLLGSSFFFCVALLPSTLPLVRLFTRMRPYFSLYKLNASSPLENLALLILGEYVNFNVETAIAFGLGEVVGFFGMIYFLWKSSKNPCGNISRKSVIFLLISFLLLLIDYRIMKLFLVNPPFGAERIWLFENFLVLPFLTMPISSILGFLCNKSSKAFRRKANHFETSLSFSKGMASATASVILVILLSGWVSVSLYYGYPHYGPLQTTSYEIEAAKYIDEHTSENYIVIADQWFIYAGEIFYGVNNPRAFYFSHWDARGTRLFLNMKRNPSPSVMVEAMKYNNASVAYFVIERPRIGEEQYNLIIQQAQQNGLQTFKVFYYEGEEKLRIFSHSLEEHPFIT